MTDAEKVETAVNALLRLHGIIYARTLEVGSTDYFKARDLIVDTLKKLDALEQL